MLCWSALMFRKDRRWGVGVLGASRQPMNQVEAADGEPRSKLWAIYKDLLAGGGGRGVTPMKSTSHLSLQIQ